ncbi:hypothetical protein BpHYR1_020975 [Brachionus plicatilis]|uniref:Uncharacterized protein n=1 Tax=Brachionus plicatilis TaxID=10195 RepID=A0A3M7QQF7_BRAPC|nr:hypothetical protein BpHYR1_020975 [Brachionus plicatilis]
MKQSETTCVSAIAEREILQNSAMNNMTRKFLKYFKIINCVNLDDTKFQDPKILYLGVTKFVSAVTFCRTVFRLISGF